MFKGNITSLVTPMNKKKNVDYFSLKNIINFQIKNNIKNIVILGTTGESSTICFNEKIKIISFVKKVIKKKAKIIVGNCSNSTDDSVYFNKILEKKKIDGILQIVPYYNNPGQNGIYKHFEKVCKNVNLPIIIYNIPKRTSINISEENIYKLSKIKNIVGIKNSYDDISFCLKIIQKYKNKKFNFYCGDDIYSTLFFLFGAIGNISVASNIIPKEMNNIYTLIKKNKTKEIKQYYFKIFNLIKSMFIETNPIPIKWLLSKSGMIKNYLRLPLTKLRRENKKIIKNIFLNYKKNFFKEYHV